jgi:hypothetical protein
MEHCACLFQIFNIDQEQVQQSIQVKHKQILYKVFFQKAISIQLSYLVGDVVGKPIKPLVQPFTRCSTSALDVPASQGIICVNTSMHIYVRFQKATVTLAIFETKYILHNGDKNSVQSQITAPQVL